MSNLRRLPSLSLASRPGRRFPAPGTADAGIAVSLNNRRAAAFGAWRGSTLVFFVAGARTLAATL